MTNILARIRRTVVTEETYEDLTPASQTPDTGFAYGYAASEYEPFVGVWDFEDDDQFDDVNTEAPVTGLPLTVVLTVDGHPGGTFTYSSVEEFAQRILDTNDIYSSADEIVLNIKKR